MYMSYCRFEGTLSELRACMDTVDEHINEEAQYEVSDKEITCFKNMVQEFVEWLTNTSILDDEGSVDWEELDRVCDMMGKSYETDDE